jgi:hypothetical protein
LITKYIHIGKQNIITVDVSDIIISIIIIANGRRFVSMSQLHILSLADMGRSLYRGAGKSLARQGRKQAAPFKSVWSEQ